MKKISLFLLSFLINLNLSAQVLKNTVKANNTFAFEFYKKVSSIEKNSFVSPYSISSSLAMTYAGARNETEKQMSSVMHYDLDQTKTHQGFKELNSIFHKIGSDPAIKLIIANALWQRAKLKEDFLELTKKYYDAAIYPLKGAAPINQWADKNTNGRIPEIVTEDDVSTAKLVLTNAIYFKADWLTMFEVKDTHKENFNLADGNTIKADMMNQVEEVGYFEDMENQVIDLPYKGETMSMTIILPKLNSSVQQLAAGLDEKKFSEYRSGIKKQDVIIALPKFSFTADYTLSNVLKGMGITDAFSGVADFSGMAPSLFISEVIHKSFIEVNEKGSEAAAVTAVIIVETSKVNNEKIFRADRPFMFLISDKETGSVLFMGTVMNPNMK
jgi:serpin B